MRSLRAFVLALSAAGIVSIGGCRDATPLPLEEVRGTVTYDDGSLIKADKIRIVFEPQGIEAKGKVAPRAAEAYAEASTGAFGELTTWKYGDGALVGRHKVVVTSLQLDKRGNGEPTKAVPPVYQQAETTPLEVEVVEGGENVFPLKIVKGG